MSLAVALTAQAAFNHPGVWGLDVAQLQTMKANLNVDPWKTGWTQLQAQSQAQLTYTMQGPFQEVGRDPSVNLTQYENDVTAIFDDAIQWYMTGNSAYADKAIQIMNAWATTHTVWSGATPGLAAGWDGTRLVAAMEILRYTYPGWTATDTDNCRSYFQNMIWNKCLNADVRSCMPQPSQPGTGNQGFVALAGMIVSAVFLDDQAKFDQTVNIFKSTNTTDVFYCAALDRNTLSTGELGETGRDQGHALMNVEWTAAIALTARSQGLNLFSHLNNRILALSEYWCKYNLGNSVTYSPFGECCQWRNSISAVQRQSWEARPESMVYGAYVIQDGMSAPYTKQCLDSTPVTIDSFLFSKQAGSLPAPWASGDLGSVGLAGGAAYSGGTFVVSGAGSDIGGTADSCQYVYQTLTGDGSIVARVATSSGGGKVGVLMRESTSPNAIAVAMVLDSGTGTSRLACRASTGGNTTWVNGAAAAAPRWLRLVRAGNIFTGSVSTDGSSWTTVGTATATMASSAKLGLTVCSRNPALLNTSTFTNVTATP